MATPFSSIHLRRHVRSIVLDDSFRPFCTLASAVFTLDLGQESTYLPLGLSLIVHFFLFFVDKCDEFLFQLSGFDFLGGVCWAALIGLTVDGVKKVDIVDLTSLFKVQSSEDRCDIVHL